MYPYAFHAAAEIFPLMDEVGLAGLAEDIREHGLKEPIVLYTDGSILDGRNRYLACERADVSPRFRDWDGYGTPLDYVISLNLKRRHLTPSQLGMVALDLKPLLEAEAMEHRLANLKRGTKSPIATTVAIGKTNELAAARLGISGKTVERAAAVAAKGVPEVGTQGRKSCRRTRRRCLRSGPERKSASRP